MLAAESEGRPSVTPREPEPPPRYPRDKETLLRDLTLVERLKDIREASELRDRLAPRWWEAAVGLVQFAAALGLMASLLQHPTLRGDAFGRLIVFWMTVMILSLVLGFEFLIFRLHTLRRANEIMLRRIEDLTHRVEAEDKAIESLRQPESNGESQ